VPTKRLNERVKRNKDRFPNDFVFQLDPSKMGRGGRRYASFAFTEHGAIMLAAILNAPRATGVSVYVAVRAFVKLREMKDF